MKAGDKVLTSQGEYGTIAHAWDCPAKAYDWWVDLIFEFEGKLRTSRIMYRAADLTVIDALPKNFELFLSS